MPSNSEKIRRNRLSAERRKEARKGERRDELYMPQDALKEVVGGLTGARQGEWFPKTEGTPEAGYALGNTALDLVADPLSFVPMGSVASKLARNLPTQLDHFYAERPDKRLQGLTKGGAKATRGAVREAFDPQLNATARDYGTGITRREELLNPVNEKGEIKEGIRQGNVNASAIMATQSKKAASESTIAKNMPSFKKEVKSVGDLGDKEDVMRTISQDTPDLDPVIAERAYNHLRKNEETSGVIFGRDRAAAGGYLGAEAAGAGKGISGTKTMFSEKATNAWKKYAGEEPSSEDWIEFINSFNAFASNNLRKPKYKKLPKSLQENPAQVVKTYWAAKAAKKSGKKLTDNQKVVLNLVNSDLNPKLNKLQQKLMRFVPKALRPSFKTSVKPITFSDGTEGHVFQQSFASSAKDLGGVNVFVVVDPKKEEYYTMIADTHDLFGQKPPGWQGAVNVVPIKKFSLAEGAKKDADQTWRGDGKASSARYSDTSDLERVSGMKRGKGESTRAFENRVTKDFKGEIQGRDLAEAYTNRWLTGAQGTGMLAQSEDKKKNK